MLIGSILTRLAIVIGAGQIVAMRPGNDCIVRAGHDFQVLGVSLTRPCVL